MNSATNLLEGHQRRLGLLLLGSAVAVGRERLLPSFRPHSGSAAASWRGEGGDEAEMSVEGDEEDPLAAVYTIVIILCVSGWRMCGNWRGGRRGGRRGGGPRRRREECRQEEDFGRGTLAIINNPDEAKDDGAEDRRRKPASALWMYDGGGGGGAEEVIQGGHRSAEELILDKRLERLRGPSKSQPRAHPNPNTQIADSLTDLRSFRNTKTNTKHRLVRHPRPIPKCPMFGLPHFVFPTTNDKINGLIKGAVAGLFHRILSSKSSKNVPTDLIKRDWFCNGTKIVFKSCFPLPFSSFNPIFRPSKVHSNLFSSLTDHPNPLSSPKPINNKHVLHAISLLALRN
ncbi:hypothetical protein L596_018106 [Steinernema carpocapsae]|uniref:Uncharacterized protein n=1 Tax=Steinernema carpocapsae TaxID=34508 RepID=A0A4U5N4D9_STECR|nr:hypothetical protein L596_018106 [Steinernema carpocapsae]